MMLRTKAMLVAITATFCGVQAAFANGILSVEYALDPKGSYLMDPGNRSPVGPLFIDLAALGLYAGTNIQVVAKGGLCYFGTASKGTPDAPCLTGDHTATTPQWAAYLGGVFSEMGPGSTHSYLLDGSQLNRLPGAIPSGLANVSNGRSYIGGMATEIPQDFWIPDFGVNITIPVNARYLVVAVLDNYYKDNSDPIGRLGVQITAETLTPNPEPSTIGLLFAGFATLVAVKHNRKRTATK